MVEALIYFASAEMSMMRNKSSSLAPPSTSALLFALLSQSMAVLRIIEATRAQDEIAEEVCWWWLDFWGGEFAFLSERISFVCM